MALGQLQDADFKSEADLNALGLDKTYLPSAAKVYSPSRDKTIEQILIDGDAVSPFIQGSRGAPVALANGDTVPFSGTVYDNIIFLVSTGGAVVASGISNGNVVGQRLTTIATSDVNSVEVDGTNGANVGQNNCVFRYLWDGSNWLDERKG